MKLYYHIIYKDFSILLKVYTTVDSTIEPLCKIPCRIGDNILLLIEDYFKENEIKIEFDELIPVQDTF